MEDLAVTCPLVPNASRLISGSCSSPRNFALGFLRTPPRDDALALWLTFGSTYTWCQDLHPTGFVPCTAHTLEITGTQREPRSGLLPLRVRVERLVRPQLRSSRSIFGCLTATFRSVRAAPV